jgi:hypothetical protein
MHELRLYATDGTLLGATSFRASSDTDSFGFNYGWIPSAVTLEAGAEYMIVSREGDDPDRFAARVGVFPRDGDFTIVGAVFSSDGATFHLEPGDRVHGPVSFQYWDDNTQFR